MGVRTSTLAHALGRICSWEGDRDRISEIASLLTARVGPSKHYTVLLLGQAGSGKTSLLNLIASFHHVSGAVYGKQLSAEALHRLGGAAVNDGQIERSAHGATGSRTSDSRLYQVNFAGACLNIFDTPGLGNSRDADADRRHLKRVMGCLGAAPERAQAINCALLVIDGREARWTATLRYLFALLASAMPRSILDKVAVVFTHCANRGRLNFDVQRLQVVGLKIRAYACVDNPFCEAKEAVDLGQEIKSHRLAGMSADIKHSIESIAQLLKAASAFEGVPTAHFLELNRSREEVEAILGNMLQKRVDKDKCRIALASVGPGAPDDGAAAPAGRASGAWQMHPGMFERSHYVCRADGCHHNCSAAQVARPLAQAWCWMNEQRACGVCGHSFKLHGVGRAGWQRRGEAEGLSARLRQIKNDMYDCAVQLNDALEQYSQLGIRDAYVHLLKSRSDLFSLELEASPKDVGIKRMLSISYIHLADIESSAEATCCICWERPADTRLNCGHKQFCEGCSALVGFCPLCREVVTERSPLAECSPPAIPLCSLVPPPADCDDSDDGTDFLSACSDD